MKFVKYFFLLVFAIFTFYVSDKMLIYVESKNPIMQTIKDLSSSYEIKSVDAIIKGDTIIPGKKGRKVNERESYLNMKEFKTFNETFLIFNYIEPNISLNDNKDKIIIKGNKKDSISLIVNNEEIDEYLNNLKIEHNKIIYSKEEVNNKMVEYINGNRDINISTNNKICIMNISNIGNCQKKGFYLVKPSLIIEKNNINLINKIGEGDVILIDKNISLVEFKIIHKEIKSKNLSIIKISDLIAE